MNLLFFAFVMGLAGSIHCAGMCGPIILSMPFAKENHFVNLLKQASYHFGRISVYVMLGLGTAALGNTVSVFADQQLLSLIIGFLMITVSALFFIGIKFKAFNNIHNKGVLFVSKYLNKFYPSKFFPVLAGMLNGIIPCGMVYVALGITTNAGSVWDGGKFMLLFGLGTMPLLLFISLGGVYIRKYFKFNNLKLIPVAGVLMGSLFITRALQLDIPFLSPKLMGAVNTFCG